MAVVHCEEVTGRDGSQDIDERKRYTRTWQILCDDPNDTAATVKGHVELPDYGDPHPGDPDAFCVELRVSQTDGENHQNWQANAEYVGRGNPTFEPADVQWPTTKFQKVVQRDVNGQLIANSAGDPFESGLTKDATRFQLTVTKNVLTWNPIEAAAFQDTINEDPFLADRHPPGFPQGTCKLTLSAAAVWYEDQSDIHYWKRTATVEVNLDGWNEAPLDAGFHAIVDVPALGLRRGKIIMPDGTTPSTPQPLDGAGGRLNPGDDPVYCDGTGGAPGPFQLYQLASWAALALEY